MEKINNVYGLHSFVSPEKYLLDDIRCEIDENHTIRVSSDTTLILDSKRLYNTLGVDVTNDIFKNFISNETSGENKYSDEQLIQMIKSRYLQSPTEVKAWLNTLIEEGNLSRDTINELKTTHEREQLEALAEQKAKELANKQLENTNLE